MSPLSYHQQSSAENSEVYPYLMNKYLTVESLISLDSDSEDGDYS